MEAPASENLDHPLIKSLEKTAEFKVEFQKRRIRMDKELNLTEKIIGAAIEVHNYWGPGLLESIYEKSLAHELMLRGASVKRRFV